MADYLEYYWGKLLDITGDDAVRGWIVVPNLIAIFMYWIIAGFFMALDMLPKSKFIMKYKVQPYTHDPLEMDKLPSVIKQVLFNQFCVQIPFSIIFHPIVYVRGAIDIDYVRPIPPAWIILLDFIVFEITREILFYYIHRLLHHPRLYKKYHKMHHEWTSPIALTAQYCHPIEHLSTNLLPAVIGPLIMGSHVISVAIWYVHSTFRTVYDHCGYNFPLLIYNSEKHDYHHMRFNSCFGVLGIMDWIHGTDISYREYKDKLKQND